MNKTKAKGFTLIELIVVIAIIGVLAAILVPSMIGYVRKAKRTSDISSAKEIFNDTLALISSNKVALASFTDTANGSQQCQKTDGDNGPLYTMNMVAYMDGAMWMPQATEYADFCNEFNNEKDYSGNDTKIPIRYQPKNEPKELNCWVICYRDDAEGGIEVWVANKGSGSITDSDLLYRVYPEPTY